MNRKSLLLITLISYLNVAYSSNTITSCIPPAIIAKLANYEIIASNQSVIETAKYFRGSNLTYSIKYKLQNKLNKLSINTNTGTINITAEAKDNFDITVQAKNACGKITNTFNVIIDEEV